MRVILLASLVGTAACGEIKSEKPDAAIDADLKDADLSAPLTVITQAHVSGLDAIDAPVANIDVIAILPNGMVNDMTKSDATGHATVKVFPGGSVTAIYPHTVDMGADLVTYMGVKPGDTLTFGQRFGSVTSTGLGSMSVSWPQLGGATQFDVFTPCGGFGFGGALSGSVSAQSSCATTPYEALMLAFDNNGNNVGFNTTSTPTFTAGGSLSIGGWSTPQNAVVNVSGLPDEVTFASADFSVMEGIQQSFEQGSGGPVTGNAFTGGFKWPPAGDRTFAQLFVERNGPYSETEVMDSLQTGTLSYTVADAKLPPWMSSSTVSCPAATAVWFPIPTTQANTLDGAVTQVFWQHQVTMGGTTTTNQFQWNFITPPEVTAFNFPALPSQFATDLPQPEDFCNGSTRLIVIPSASGYDAFRAVPERNLVCPECAVREGEIPRMIVNN